MHLNYSSAQKVLNHDDFTVAAKIRNLVEIIYVVIEALVIEGISRNREVTNTSIEQFEDGEFFLPLNNIS